MLLNNEGFLLMDGLFGLMLIAIIILGATIILRNGYELEKAGVIKYQELSESRAR